MSRPVPCWAAGWILANNLGFNGRQPVFCTITSRSKDTRSQSTQPGQLLDQTYVRLLMKRLARKAGIEKRVHPHGLRQTHAFELACEGKPMHVIQQQLGHSNASITSRYINHLNPQEVVQAMRERKWSLT